MPDRPCTVKEKRTGMKINSINLSDPQECGLWDNFVASHPDGTVFHLSCWLRVLEKTYKFSPHHLGCTNGNGRMTGLLPGFLVHNPFRGIRYVSLPFSDYGGALTNNLSDQEELTASLRKKLPTRLKSIELRNDCGSRGGFQKQNF